MEYEALEREHAELMERMAVMCRSNGERFTELDRLRVIKEELKNTPYQGLFDDRLFYMWSKVPIEELPEDVVLVSTHVDIVPSISKCSSMLRDDGFYSGTYDNIGTNTAAVLLMKEYDFPPNIVFAFTGDEETGDCMGAKQAAKLLSNAGKNLTCIALDVTYEGFDENRLCSIENCTAPEEEPEFLNKIAKTAVDTENEQSFCFVKAGKKHVPTELDEKYLSPSTGMYDEAFAYRDKGYPALSFCLPCDGHMHSNSGVLVKQPVFEGYVISLASFLFEFTKTHPQLIEAHKIAKDMLVSKAADIEFVRPKPVYESVFSGYSFNGRFHNYDDYEDDDDYYFGDDFLLDDDEENENPWFEMDELSDLSVALYSEAVMYGPDEEDAFVNDMEIPQEYMKVFCSDPDGAVLPEEEKAMEEYLRGLFRNVHGLEFYKNDEYDEYFEQWMDMLAKEKGEYTDTETEKEYLDL